MCLSGVSHLELEEGIELPFMFPPLTRTGGYDSKSLRETILKCKEMFEDKGYPFSLRLVPVHMLDIIKEACPEINFEDDRPTTTISTGYRIWWSSKAERTTARRII